MSRYGIRDIFDTIQGEGMRVGTRAVFVRFSGCNLWDGNPLHRDRGEGVCSMWCDTDFQKGEVLSATDLAFRMSELWPRTALGDEVRWCVLTGGEPGLQVDDQLVELLHDAGWRVAVETNGTVACSAFLNVDHLCVAPKLGTKLNPQVLENADEVKFILPGLVVGHALGDVSSWTYDMMAFIASEAPHAELFVQPQDPVVPGFVEQSALRRSVEVSEDAADELGAGYLRNLARCIDFVKAHPKFRLSVQIHKFISLP